MRKVCFFHTYMRVPPRVVVNSFFGFIGLRDLRWERPERPLLLFMLIDFKLIFCRYVKERQLLL